MNDELLAAAALLVAGSGLAWLSAMNPALFRYWSAPREDGLAIVRAHRLAWTLLNSGFIVATVVTAAGLVLLALALGGDAFRSAALVAVAVAYVMGGTLWCADLAIRIRTTPALADLVARGAPTEPAEALLGAATTGLFTAFTLVTAVALVVLGLTLAIAGGVALPVALLGAVIAGIVIVTHLVTGDSVPAILYLPTLFIGVALLLGWT
jgi:hypothetical protein